MPYQVVDNFLPEIVHREMKNNILDSSSFPWFYYDYVESNTIENKLNKNQLFFCHTFYINDLPNSNNLNILDNLLYAMRVDSRIPTIKSLIRIKANLYPCTPQSYTHGYHTDYNFSSFSAIYYINTNNGYTLIKNNDDIIKIDSIENRLLVMTSDLLHSSTTCTDEKMRCTVNINYF